MRSLIAVLDHRIAKIDARMRAIIKADPKLAEADRRLQNVRGVGPTVVATLIAGCPNLAGLTVEASRPSSAFMPPDHDAISRAFRTRLEAAGKPVKIAITATPRKLLTVLNAMLTSQTDSQRETPT